MTPTDDRHQRAKQYWPIRRASENDDINACFLKGGAKKLGPLDTVRMASNISQGTVAIYLRYCGIFIVDSVTYLLLSLTVKDVEKSLSIWRGKDDSESYLNADLLHLFAIHFSRDIEY